MAFLERNANRGSVPTGYDIDNSLKLEADNSESLRSNSISTSPTNTKIGTFSWWVKRSELGANYLLVAGNSARYSRIFFNSSDQLQLYAGDSGWNSVQPITNAVYRDTAAWYHLVLRIDSNNGTAANRLRLYSNGVEQTWGTSPNITQNANMTLLEAFSSPGYQAWGANLAYYSANAFFSGYLAEVHYVDGQSLAPTSFGETDEDTGIWKPKKYSGAHGNCGYYLDFADSGNLGDNEASTGSTFDFNENNIAAIDQSTDTPTNNFCTLSPLWDFTTNPTISEGATKSTPTGSHWCGAKASVGLSAGKWYWEWKASSQSNYMGVQTDGEDDLHDGNAQNNQMGAFFVHDGEFKIYDADSTSGRNDTDIDYPTFNSAHIFAVALDMDNNVISFYQNGTLVPNSGGGGGNLALDGLSNKTVFPTAAQYDVTFEWNFGGYTAFSISSAQSDENGYGTFEHAPPSGYLAICTKNLAENGG